MCFSSQLLGSELLLSVGIMLHSVYIWYFIQQTVDALQEVQWYIFEVLLSLVLIDMNNLLALFKNI